MCIRLTNLSINNELKVYVSTYICKDAIEHAITFACVCVLCFVCVWCVLECAYLLRERTNNKIRGLKLTTTKTRISNKNTTTKQ